MSQDGVRALSPLGGQIITAGSYLQTKSSVKKKNTRKYYCSPELFLRVYDTRLSTITVYIPQACGQIHPHTLTLPLTLAHSSFLMLHT